MRLVEETARTWISTKGIQITLQGEGVRVRVRECIVKKMTVIYAYIHRSDSSLLRASQENWIKDHWITGSRIKDQGSRIKDQNDTNKWDKLILTKHFNK